MRQPWLHISLHCFRTLGLIMVDAIYNFINEILSIKNLWLVFMENESIIFMLLDH